jgi:hypothetical protein
MINYYISQRTLFFLTIILFLLGFHIFYGCCSLTITKNTETNTTTINNKDPFNTKNELTDLYNKYSTENHFYIPDKSLSSEEIKYIAHRGGNNA